MLPKSLLPRRRFITFFIAFGIFLLILLAVSLPILSRQTRQVQENTLQIYSETINHNLQKIDTQVASFQSLLQSWRNVNPNFVLQCNPNRAIDYLGLKENSNKLNSMVINFPDLRDIMILTEANSIITLSTVVVDRADLLTFYLRNSFPTGTVASVADFRSLSANTVARMPVSAPNYGTYDALLFFQPIYNKNFQVIAHSMLTVDLKELLHSIAPDDLLNNSCIQLFWKDTLIDTLQGELSEKNTVMLTGRGEKTGLAIVFYVSSTVLNAGVGSTLNILWLLVATAFLGGLALTLFFFARTSTPMRSLMQKAHTLAPDVCARDEYEFVAQALSYLDRSLQKNSQELEVQRQALQQNFLEKALLGNIASRQNQKDFAMLLPDFPDKYMVALLHMPKGKTDRPIDFTLSKQLLLDEMLSSQFSQTLYHLNITPNLVAMILPEDCGGIPALEKLQSALLKECQMPINIFVSEFVSGPEFLSEAYAQAKRIQRLASGYIEKRVWHIANFPQREILSNMDYSILQQLYESISNGEKETALRCLKRLQMALTSNTLVEGDGIWAYSFRRTLSFLHSILIRIKQEHFDELSSVQMLPPELNQRLDDYFAVIEGYVVTLCDVLYTRKHQPTAYSEDIVAYVDKHFTDPNLYQKTVTDYFNISEKALQAAIRSQTQLSFAEYLEKKRLDLAHQLLLNTKMNVKEISTQVGFSLYNTFYKAFKRRWGCSPTEYQLQYGHIIKGGEKP